MRRYITRLIKAFDSGDRDRLVRAVRAIAAYNRAHPFNGPALLSERDRLLIALAHKYTDGRYIA
jgi:hypothetical protein